PIVYAQAGQQYACPIVVYPVITKSSREPDSRDVHRLELDSPGEIRRVCVFAENTPACREVHLGAVITYDLDTPPPLLADDAVNREAPHIVLVGEQQSDLGTRTVGASRDRIPGAPDRE